MDDNFDKGRGMIPDTITLLPGRVSGRLRVPASKSLCHRAILCAALSEGDSVIENITWSKDIEATAFCAERLGAVIRQEGDRLLIHGIGGKNLNGRVERLFCGESGSTVRFLIPICGVLGVRALFTGLGRLPQRPLDIYYQLMEEHGFAYERETGDHLPLGLRYPWKGGRFAVDGTISSQFVTGLLMALPLAQEDSVIEITTRLESKPYVDLTLDVLRLFGIQIENESYRRFRIPGGQSYRACHYVVEGDYSQAAAILCASASAGEPSGLVLDGLRADSHQGDRVVLDLLEQMGVQTQWLLDGGLNVTPADALKNIVMDAENCPDLVPVMAALGAFGEGVMRIINAERLRIKESDRLKAICTEFKKCGVSIEETADGLLIFGQPDGLYEGGEADAHNDHRIAMSLSVLALRSFSGIRLSGWQCVEKSWPSYWRDYMAIGGEIDE